MAKEVVVTREGYNKLEQELENLRTVKRKDCLLYTSDAADE